MRKFHSAVVALALGSVAAAALAQDVGRVISSTPVLQQVAVPRQVCSDQQVAVQAPKSGAGALMGAIAGGAMGNAVGGHGAGNAAATMIGLMGGAIVGDRIEGAPPAQLQTVQHCVQQTFMENRTVAYNVEYEFAGRRYSVQMPNDPGPTIALQVAPVGAQAATGGSLAQAPATGYAAAPVYVNPPVVVQQAPVYYAQPYYYPPVRFEYGFGLWDGHRRHWH